MKWIKIPDIDTLPKEDKFLIWNKEEQSFIEVQWQTRYIGTYSIYPDSKSRTDGSFNFQAIKNDYSHYMVISSPEFPYQLRRVSAFGDPRPLYECQKCSNRVVIHSTKDFNILQCPNHPDKDK